MSEPSFRFAEMLGDDHRRIDALFERFQGTPLSAVQERRERLAAFTHELRRHIRLEEDELFPALADTDESSRRLVPTLLEEHRRIEEAMQRIEQEVEASGASTEKLELELINELWAHNAREEESVYPWLDQHLSVEKASRLLQALRDDPSPIR